MPRTKTSTDATKPKTSRPVGRPKSTKTADVEKTTSITAETSEKIADKTAKNPSVAEDKAKTSKSKNKAEKIDSKTKTENSSVEKTITITRGEHIVMVAGLAFAIVASALCLGYCVWDFIDENLHASTPIYSLTDGNSANFTEGSIADVAAKVTPSVVSIVTETTTTGFFGQSLSASAAGTGMIVTSDGYILTNKHVVDGANTIQVVLDDGTIYEKVKLVGTDPLNDVAFLKIEDANDLPAVTLGDSKTIAAGQQVIAIGNALGQLQNTITSGIISGTGRTITASDGTATNSESLVDMIQTDAAINSGNSGGPLVNAAGEVIGINTATSSGADGIGFAIPISSVKGMLNNIIKNNSATRAHLGISYLIITPEIATTYNLPVTSGAYIFSPSQYSAITNNGPAAKAGLKDKDIILAIGGVRIGKSGSVSSLIGEYMPGDIIEVLILREGKEQVIKVTLGTYSAK